jgi:hypothetical protein
MVVVLLILDVASLGHETQTEGLTFYTIGLVF